MREYYQIKAREKHAKINSPTKIMENYDFLISITCLINSYNR
jgi:hypothetical protein